MPSPVGHALGGLAAGVLVAGVSSRDGAVDWPVAARHGLLFAAVGVAPDLDLLFGAHSGPTHGLGAALLAGAAAFLIGRVRLLSSGRLALAVAVAYASHTLLDWLGHDTRAPIGIMALWPFTREYYESSLHLFMGVSRRYWLPGFWQHNLLAVLRELAILVPLVALIVILRARRSFG